MESETDILRGGTYLNRDVNESCYRKAGCEDEQDARKRIKRIIAQIPKESLLGVMATTIYPERGSECLVCRLVEPEKPYYASDNNCSQPWTALAKRYEISEDDADWLFSAALWAMDWVEEAIADRLNEIVEV